MWERRQRQRRAWECLVRGGQRQESVGKLSQNLTKAEESVGMLSKEETKAEGSVGK